MATRASRRPEDPTARDSFEGRWVTSYSGWMLYNPPIIPALDESHADFRERLRAMPPIFPAYHAESMTLQPSYIAFAAMTCLKFDGRGELIGKSRLVRGGTGKELPDGTHLIEAKNNLSGTYEFSYDPEIETVTGMIITEHVNMGEMLVRNYYRAFVKDEDEIEWLWCGGSYREQVDTGWIREPYRALVTRGTLKRMSVFEGTIINPEPR